MTKADLLRKLNGLPMNMPIVFAHSDPDRGVTFELELEHAYTVTGRDGLTLVLAEEPSAADEYPDAEEVFR